MRCLDLLSFYAPAVCPNCGGLPFDGTPGMFCKDCLQKLPFVLPPYCPGCGGTLDGMFDLCGKCLHRQKHPWQHAYTAFDMDGLARKAIVNLKYNRRTAFARPLGTLLGQHLRQVLVPDDSYVLVPVPLHWRRYLWRGFNQADLIARFVSRETGIPVVTGLRRVRYTRQQARLNLEERITNLSGAFAPIHSHKWKNRAILLIDDVFTTGITLSLAAEVLLNAGAKSVSAVSVARR